jgi:hypothetical protein
MGDREEDTFVSWWMNPQASAMGWPTSFQDVAGEGLEISLVMACCCEVPWNLNLRGISWVTESLSDIGLCKGGYPFIQEWWVPGVTPVTSTALRAANIIWWGPFQLGWSTFLLIFYVSYFFNWVELPWQKYSVSIYVHENLLFFKVKNNIFKY